MKINKIGNKIIYNIPYNINRIEYNNPSENGNVDIRKKIPISEIELENKDINYQSNYYI